MDSRIDWVLVVVTLLMWEDRPYAVNKFHLFVLKNR